MPTNSYDLVVLGDELAGLVAATLCARRGMRVLVARTSARPDTYAIGRFRLPVAAVPLVGLGSPAVKRIVDELHFQHLIKRKLREREPGCQLVFPDARIDLSGDDEALARELRRELPDEAEQAEAWCARAAQLARLLDPIMSQDIALPPTGFWERREIARTAGRLEAEAAAWAEELAAGTAVGRALFELPAIFEARAGVESLSAASRARCFDLWRHGTPRLPGDGDGLREMFLDKFGSHNGEVRTVELEEVSVGWNKVTSIRLADGEELGAQYVIAAMPVGELAPYFGKKAPKRLRQEDGALEPVGCRYTLNLVVSEAGIPEGMASTVLAVADPAAPLCGDNALAIFVGEPDESARVVVTIQAICPHPGRRGGGEGGDDDSGGDRPLDDVLADLRVAIRERLEMVMPFLSEHVLLAHSPHESAPAEGPAAVDAAFAAIAPEPVWRLPEGASLGVGGVSYGLGLKNLALATSQVLPGLGFEGVLEVGWCAAKIACTATGKKRDFLRDEVIAGA